MTHFRHHRWFWGIREGSPNKWVFDFIGISNEYPLHKVNMGLIIKGTIPSIPPFSLWCTVFADSFDLIFETAIRRTIHRRTKAKKPWLNLSNSDHLQKTRCFKIKSLILEVSTLQNCIWTRQTDVNPQRLWVPNRGGAALFQQGWNLGLFHTNAWFF